MNNKKLNIGTILIVWLYVLFPSKLNSENPEWMYFHEIEEVRGLEPIGDFIYIGSYNKGLTLRLSLETLELDTVIETASAFSFAEDSKGAVWIATWKGLYEYKDDVIVNKYDRTNSNLKRYPGTTNPQDLMYNDITVDKYDNKWLASDTGLVRFDGVEAKFFTHVDPKKEVFRYYTGLLLDSDGESLWLFTGGSLPEFPFRVKTSVMKFKDGVFAFYDTSNSNIDNISFRGIVKDANGNIFIGTLHFEDLPNSGKLIKFDGQEWEHLDADNFSLTTLNIWCLGIDTISNILWIGTRKGGLIKFDSGNWSKFDSVNSNISRNRVEKIVIDKYGNKWIVTPGTSLPNGFSSLEVFREGGVLLPTNVKELIRKHDEKTPVVYPNPAQDIIKVTDLIKRERAYSISNIYGQVLMEGTFFHEINISRLPAGFYFLKVNDKFLKFVKIDSKN